jgi:phosphoserine phosphatase
MARLAEREGIDLSESYAYSDSESDLPMLRAVGHPVAVNPDGPLARVARQEGWDVLRFDRLSGRLKMLGGLTAATLLGAAGRSAAARRAGAR